MALHYTLRQEMDPVNQDIPEPLPPDQAGWLGLSVWLSDPLAQIIRQVRRVAPADIEEVRLRVGQPLLLVGAQKEFMIDARGEVNDREPYRVKQDDFMECLEKMTQSSVYAAEEELKQGFLTLPGGHRVGVVGEAVMEQGRIQSLKHISGLNIRLAENISGAGKRLLPLLLAPGGRLRHTLILSIPRAGKTTLLRDLIRWLSDGVPELGLKGQSVGVVDERGELAGMWQGVPTYYLGMRTDVLDGCPKAVGMGMLVRAMAPCVLAVDELGHRDDVDAVAEALRTGVSILSTAHAGSVQEAMQRPSLRAILEEGIFERAVLLSRRKGPGSVEGVYDLSNGLKINGG